MTELLEKTQEKMDKTINALNKEYSMIRAGRAAPSVLDKIQIDYYGVMTPISQVANISVFEARSLLIQPYDPSQIRDIEKAIQMSDLGINPSNDGKIIRLVFPPLTEERRREIVKNVSKLCEEAKVSIRNIRRDAIEKFKTMKKNSEITEDDLSDCEKDVQDYTDKHIKKIDDVTKEKEKEIMEL